MLRLARQEKRRPNHQEQDKERTFQTGPGKTKNFATYRQIPASYCDGRKRCRRTLSISTTWRSCQRPRSATEKCSPNCRVTFTHLSHRDLQSLPGHEATYLAQVKCVLKP